MVHVGLSMIDGGLSGESLHIISTIESFFYVMLLNYCVFIHLIIMVWANALK